MKLANSIEKLFKQLLPSPFTIAILLTLLSFLIALFFTGDKNTDWISHGIHIMSYWEKGLWNFSLLVFAIQMMLMLVLGHVLALSKFASTCIKSMTKSCNNTANAAFIVCLSTLLVSLFNWGLGLILGLSLQEKLEKMHKKISGLYTTLSLAPVAYSGLMVWHGGISGSAPVKASEPGHISFLNERYLQ